MYEFGPIIRLSTLYGANSFEIWGDAAGDGNSHSIVTAGDM